MRHAVQETAVRERTGAKPIADEESGEAEVGECIAPVHRLINVGGSDEHSAWIDRVQDEGLEELNILVELKERQAGPRSGGDAELNWTRAPDAVVRGVHVVRLKFPKNWEL